MAYTPEYETADLSKIVVDILGSAGAQIVQWIGIIILLGVVVYLVARVRQLGRVF